MPSNIHFNKYQKRASDYHWQQINRSIFKYNAFVAARYQQVVYLIPKIKNQKILDIGCGDGVLLYLVNQNLNKKNSDLVGIDLDQDSLKTARKKVKAKFFHSNAYKLPFKNNQFNCILATEIIEHLTAPHKMLKEIVRCLKPGGKLILTTPIKISELPQDKMHVREYEPKELQDSLNQFFKSVNILISHPLWLTKVYNLTLFKINRYHLDIFRWLINAWVLLTNLNPFLLKTKNNLNQLAVCQK